MRNFLAENKNRKQNAKKRGLEYTLKPLSLIKIYNQQRCYYLNVPLNVKSEKFSFFTKLTLDRKDSKKGYIKDNVVACSHMANQLKNLIESGLITTNDIIECGKRMKEEFKIK